MAARHCMALCGYMYSVSLSVRPSVRLSVIVVALTGGRHPYCFRVHVTKSNKWRGQRKNWTTKCG